MYSETPLADILFKSKMVYVVAKGLVLSIFRLFKILITMSQTLSLSQAEIRYIRKHFYKDILP